MAFNPLEKICKCILACSDILSGKINVGYNQRTYSRERAS